VKIYLIGVFAAVIAVCSLFFNAFFTCVFLTNREFRRSPLFYFGVLAVADIVMAINYLALMAVPVYMDQFGWLWLYHLFLRYLRPMLTLSNAAMFASVLLILMATVERLLRTSASCKTLRKLVERNRPSLCLAIVALSLAYKQCVYFEIQIVEHEHCEDEWARYEVGVWVLDFCKSCESTGWAKKVAVGPKSARVFKYFIFVSPPFPLPLTGGCTTFFQKP